MSILRWAFIMLLVSLVAALFGFTDFGGKCGCFTRLVLYLRVIFLVLLVLGLTAFRRA